MNVYMVIKNFYFITSPKNNLSSCYFRSLYTHAHALILASQSDTRDHHITIKNRSYLITQYFAYMYRVKIIVGLHPFSDQNTGLTNQTCNHLAICADQFVSRSLLEHTLDLHCYLYTLKMDNQYFK